MWSSPSNHVAYCVRRINSGSRWPRVLDFSLLLWSLRTFLGNDWSHHSLLTSYYCHKDVSQAHQLPYQIPWQVEPCLIHRRVFSFLQYAGTFQVLSNESNQQWTNLNHTQNTPEAGIIVVDGSRTLGTSKVSRFLSQVDQVFGGTFSLTLGFLICKF